MTRFLTVLLLLVLLTSVSLITLSQPNPAPPQCGVIYVSPSGGSGAGFGTRTNPADLPTGLSMVTPSNNIIWLAAGTYTLNNELSLPNDVTLEGGFNPASWIKSNSTPTILNRTGANPLPSPANAIVAIAGLNASGFRLQDLTINVADAPSPELSVYGIYLALCSNYNVVRCEVNTGQGGPGLPGAPGTLGAPGPPGSPGLPAATDNAIPAGGAGGGNGGNGGQGAKHNPQAAALGQAGGGGGTGGNGGTGGRRWWLWWGRW